MKDKEQIADYSKASSESEQSFDERTRSQLSLKTKLETIETNLAQLRKFVYAQNNIGQNLPISTTQQENQQEKQLQAAPKSEKTGEKQKKGYRESTATTESDTDQTALREEQVTKLEQTLNEILNEKKIGQTDQYYPETPRFQQLIADAYYYLGVIYEQQLGDFDRALNAYQQVLTIMPTNLNAPEAQFQIAEIYSGEGKYTEAYNAYLALCEKFPENPKCIISQEKAKTVREKQQAQQK